MKNQFPLTAAFSSGLLTATGAETVYDTTVTIQFAIAGKMGTAKTAVTDGATPTTDGAGNALDTLTGTTTGGQGCTMVWCLTSAGAVRVFQGPVRSLDAAGTFLHAPDFPEIDLNTYCPFAYQVLKHYGTASTITFGSSNWNATGFSNAIVNVSQLPARPQIS
jgi:hypothetical protein